MAYELLLERIDERLKALKLSERKACIRASVDVNTIRHIKRGHSPKLEKLHALAKVLKVPAAYLTDAAGEEPATDRPVAMATIYVRGAVQAGVWREAIEWDGDEWFSMTVPTDDRYPGAERFGLVVKGTSMNREFDDGTIVTVVRYSDIARAPVNGEFVVVLRRSHKTGEFEATLKQYEFEEATGRHILWPRSKDPEHQEAIVIGKDRLPVSQNREKLPPTVFAGDFASAVGEADVVISALVVGDYRRR